MSILALTYLLLRFVHLLSFLRSLFICPCGSHRLLSVFCPSFVRLLSVFCSSFVRLLFVFCSSFVYLPVRLAPSFVRLTFLLLHSLSLGEGWGEDILFVFYLATLCLVACPATTAHHHRFSIIGIIGIFDIIAFSFFVFHYFTENPFPSVLSYPFTFFRSK